MDSFEEQIEHLKQEITIVEDVIDFHVDRKLNISKQIRDLKSQEFQRRYDVLGSNEERLTFFLMTDNDPMFHNIGDHKVLVDLIGDIIGRSGLPTHVLCLGVSEHDVSYSPLQVDLNVMGDVNNLDKLLTMVPICPNTGIMEMFIYIEKYLYLITSTDKNKWSLFNDQRDVLEMDVVDGCTDVSLKVVMNHLLDRLMVSKQHATITV